MKINKNMLEELKALESMRDEDIDYSDIPEITDFTGWEPNPFFKPIKAPISAKLDKDVIAWLKIHGSVSKFLNQICREKMFEEKQKLAHAL
jgi:uncharacterized protein (DUF4415 family)